MNGPRIPASLTRPLLPTLLAVLVLAGCTSGNHEATSLFVERSAETTRVAFSNDIVETPDFNIINYLYFYDGGGVAAGDVNNDGLVDLYFTANEGSNRLYLNRGDFVFEDVTEQAGVAGTADWTKGVTMADVNGDGWLDLYVSAVTYLTKKGRNALFINNGDGTFTDRAAAYGLDHEGYSSQAAFFDYDRDGDLDVYLLNHSVHTEGTHDKSYLRYERNPAAGDMLLRNDPEDGAPRFTDVSEEAGIYGSVLGYGLGVGVSDLNMDGCPDLFISNDFHEHDYLYYNNCDGTFTESIETSMGHTSRSSMGNDIADVNNDGRPDIVVLDMLPDRQDILNRSSGAEPFELYNLKREFGYHHQYVRNTLQLNVGRRRFSEIGYLSGIHATDWSWAALLADLDNDGRKDLFVTNGIYRRPNDLDYVYYVSGPNVQESLQGELTQEDLALLDSMPQQPMANVAFQNNGDLTFTNRAPEWGLDRLSYSTGATYADLDNDGDLDLVINNLNSPAVIYENRAESLPDRHHLTMILQGDGPNTAGIGTKVFLKHRGATQLLEQYVTRGWQSAVDPRLHAGLGASTAVDTLLVIWPDDRAQVLTDVPADQVLTLRQADADRTYKYPPERPEHPLFDDLTASLTIPYRHVENPFFDFSRERLIPHLLSTEGPALAVGDVNGDGLDDLFAGGAKWQPGRLLIQQPGGRFTPVQDTFWQADSLYEDVDAAFFDADADGDLDLYVVSGGNEFWGQNDALRDRLYRNDGTGSFSRAPLPDIFANGCCVAPADYDADGDVDLFVGSRVLARHYGMPPRSVLLENNGSGGFADVTATRAPDLAEAGMITGAAWSDTNRDGRPDLVVVGEWMPLSVFEQVDGRFVNRTTEAGLGGTAGWWSSVLAADMDGDGDDDLVAGNHGLNSYFQAPPGEPVRLLIKDIDRNGDLDHLLTSITNGARYPFASRVEFIEEFVSLYPRFPTYKSFGASTLEDIFTPEQLSGAVVREAALLTSTYAENAGDGTFTTRPLPMEAQFAPVFAIQADDVDSDGIRDLLLAGNFFGVGPRLGRYDASYGLLLRGDGQGGFTAVPPAVSNLVIDGEVRALRRLRLADGTPVLLAARNNGPIHVSAFRVDGIEP